MTENEIRTINGKEIVLYREIETDLYRFSKDAVDMLLEALEEREQYRAIGTVEECLEAVEKQTTVYDQNKVVDQLESELRLADKEKERCARENPLQFDSAKGYAMGLSNAIEIVKAGGADAEH